jgi:hypothetical protein
MVPAGLLPRTERQRVVRISFNWRVFFHILIINSTKPSNTPNANSLAKVTMKIRGDFVEKGHRKSAFRVIEMQNVRGIFVTIYCL